MQTGRAIAEAGLHPASGGDGTLLCSGDMLLEALAACAGVTLRAVATSLGIEVAAGTRPRRGRPRLPRHARGRPRGAGRLPRDPARASSSTTDADEEQLETLLKLTERYCVVFQTLASPPRSRPSVAAA